MPVVIYYLNLKNGQTNPISVKAKNIFLHEAVILSEK